MRRARQFPGAHHVRIRLPRRGIVHGHQVALCLEDHRWYVRGDWIWLQVGEHADTLDRWHSTPTTVHEVAVVDMRQWMKCVDVRHKAHRALRHACPYDVLDRQTR